MSFNNNVYLELLNQRKFDEALEYRASFVPDYLYKFFSLYDIESCNANQYFSDENEKRFNTLENNQLWFALPDTQNDPYEFKGMYFDKISLKEIGFSDDALSVVESLIYNIPFCCFVNNSSENLPMWAHYANNHKGYCVKYRVDNKRRVRNVIYEPSRIPISKILAAFITNAHKVEKGEGNLSDVNFYSFVLQEMLFIKHDSWANEKEYRIVYPEEKIDKGIRVDTSSVGLHAEEIICGYKCAEEHVNRLSDIAKKLSIKCTKCEISENAFTVYSDK
ncbi:MAG: DUF2971 domain-containing protein [Ruminococcus flavefaciens]|nr:DUF2971 domain-containing protein [Ruminococcus flavefaciens]